MLKSQTLAGVFRTNTYSKRKTNLVTRRNDMGATQPATY